MADTEIIPAVVEYRRELLSATQNAALANAVRVAAKSRAPVEAALLSALDKHLTPLYKEVRELETALAGNKGETLLQKAVCYRDKIIPKMRAVRARADALERLTPQKHWPFPTSADLLFYE